MISSTAARVRFDFNERRASTFTPSPISTCMAAANSDQILDVLAGVAETDEVRSNPDLALYDLQILDSMKTVELMVALSSEMGVEVSPAEFEREKWATPRLLVADVLHRLEGK